MKEYDFNKKYETEEERLKAFEYLLTVSKQLIKRKERQSTSYFVRNIDLVFKILPTNCVLLFPLLLVENLEIDSAFSRRFGTFLHTYKDNPHAYAKILHHWITKYPDIVVYNMRGSVFSLFLDSLDIENAANTFVKFYDMREKEFDAFLALMKKYRFFTRLLTLLEQTVGKDISEYECSSEYNYENIRVRFSDRLDELRNEAIKNEKKKKKEESVKYVRKENKTKDGLEGVIKEFKKLRISDEDKDKCVVGDSETENANSTHDDANDRTNDDKSTSKANIQIRRNVLAIILSFLKKYSDDSINHKIMKQSNVILNLFLEENVHIIELNSLFNILKTLVSKRNSKVLVDMMGRRMNTFKFLFNTLDDVCIKEVDKGKSKNKDDAGKDGGKKGTGSGGKEPADGSKNAGDPEKDVSNDESDDNKVIPIDFIFNNTDFIPNLEIDYVNGDKMHKKRGNYKRSVERQLVKLKESFLELHLSLKLNLLCYCSKYRKIREIIRKQLLHIYFISVFFETTNTFVLHSFTVFLENCLEDYKFMAEILLSTNLLKMIQRTGKEQYLTLYGRYPERKPMFVFNTYVAFLLMKLKRDIAAYCRVDLKVMENRNYSDYDWRGEDRVYTDYKNVIFRRVIDADVEQASFDRGRVGTFDGAEGISRASDGYISRDGDNEYVHGDMSVSSPRRDARDDARHAVSKDSSAGNEKKTIANMSTSKADIINRLLFKLRYLESDEWLFVQDGVFNPEIARYKVAYDDKSVHDYMENSMPESMYRFLFKNLVWDMPFCDIFSENGI